MKRAALLNSGLFLLLSATAVFGQAKDNTEEPAEKTDRAALYVDFEKTLSASTMVGHFMVDGDEAEQRKQERYDISRVTKLERGDYWLFNARIKYGDHDVTVPIPVEVKWAGRTPVITVDNVTIPGLGTFDARVVISDNKYAGTWRHGKVGGLMFGRIEKQPTEDKDAAE